MREIHSSGGEELPGSCSSRGKACVDRNVARFANSLTLPLSLTHLQCHSAFLSLHFTCTVSLTLSLSLSTEICRHFLLCCCIPLLWTSICCNSSSSCICLTISASLSLFPAHSIKPLVELLAACCRLVDMHCPQF